MKQINVHGKYLKSISAYSLYTPIDINLSLSRQLIGQSKKNRFYILHSLSRYDRWSRKLCYATCTASLNVDGNERRGGSGRRQ